MLHLISPDQFGALKPNLEKMAPATATLQFWLAVWEHG